MFLQVQKHARTDVLKIKNWPLIKADVLRQWIPWHSRAMTSGPQTMVHKATLHPVYNESHKTLGTDGQYDVHIFEIYATDNRLSTRLLALSWIMEPIASFLRTKSKTSEGEKSKNTSFASKSRLILYRRSMTVQNLHRVVPTPILTKYRAGSLRNANRMVSIGNIEKRTKNPHLLSSKFSKNRYYTRFDT